MLNRKKALLLTMLLSGSLMGGAEILAQIGPQYQSLSLALQAIERNQNIFIGFEATPMDRDQTPVTVDLSKSSVAEILDGIVAQKRDYKWSFEDGVYDMYPRMEANALSALTVASYTVSDATPREAMDAVDALPEVRNWLSGQHLIRNEIRSTVGFPRTQKISLTLNSVKVRTILNQLIKKSSDSREWSIYRWGDNMQYVAIRF